jgi:hypothetical protein
MKNLLSVTFLLITFTFVVQTSYSQGFPYHLYNTRTMAELTELNSVARIAEDAKKTQIAIMASPFYSAVRLEYAGESRNLSEKKLEFYKIWAETLDIGSSDNNLNILNVIKKEYLFKECDKEYWLAVSTTAANYFPKDMKKGDRMTLYLMMTGGFKFDKEAWNYMYLTNSFKIYQ